MLVQRTPKIRHLSCSVWDIVLIYRFIRQLASTQPAALDIKQGPAVAEYLARLELSVCPAVDSHLPRSLPKAMESWSCQADYLLKIPAPHHTSVFSSLQAAPEKCLRDSVVGMHMLLHVNSPKFPCSELAQTENNRRTGIPQSYTLAMCYAVLCSFLLKN